MTHPLTDIQIQDITEDVANLDWDDRDAKEDYILARRFYDLALEHFSKWIYENGDDYVIQHYEHNIRTDLDTIIADFQKAMRLQQQEDN